MAAPKGSTEPVEYSAFLHLSPALCSLSRAPLWIIHLKIGFLPLQLTFSESVAESWSFMEKENL